MPRRYLLAIVSVVLALRLSWLMEPYLSTSPQFVIFLCAIMLTAWHSGFLPAVIATVLSTALFDYYFMSPKYQFIAGTADLVTLTLFLLSGTVTAYCIVYLQRARHMALRGQDRLQHLHELSARLFEEKDCDHMLTRVLSSAMEL